MRASEKLGKVSQLVRFWYLLQHLYLVVDFFVVAFLLKILNPDPITRRHKLVHNTNRIAHKFLKAFQIELSIENKQRMTNLHDQAYLLVSNHVSYTDIIVLACLENMVFITSVEMGANPFLGAVTRYGGCLYTDRKKPVSLPGEIKKFSQTIKDGFKVVLFPEGTSTNGRTVKDFRKSLFEVPVKAQCPILPVCIRYTHLDGQEITDATRDYICWYGDMTFVPHFMKLLGRKIRAQIEILDPIPVPMQKTRAELSEAVYGQIHSSYHKSGV
ncbi:MAG TPA: lysophospholipid acyltransferase family protein [Candidatus Cloacimonadota bacterium]|nr:lysophospholipid acyltransferase family protein [Candidatus Cloacimonadota bacterium]